MSAITVENDLVHYEVLGRGKPVILVHGWLGSWRYWVPTMQQLSIKYRIYALDLWGFGDSGKNMSRVGLRDQVKLLYDFMTRMGIERAALVGHSFGAAVCIAFARQYPEKAPRLMTISAPLFDMGGIDGEPLSNSPSVTVIGPSAGSHAPTGPIYGASAETIPRNPFKGLGETPEEILANLKARTASEDLNRGRTSPVLPTAIARPVGSGGSSSTTPPSSNNPLVDLLTKDDAVALMTRSVGRDAPDFDKLKSEISKMGTDVLASSAQSFNNYNLAADLQKITAPTLLLHGEDDPILARPSDELLRQINRGKAPGAFLPFVEPNLRHFPMLEITAKFNRLLIDFLEAQDLINVQFKDQWKRTMR
ncbi:MAG: alpha/beta hydrolase [Anaerolineae bacterium]|nr:alpha/beta hydrolase [Anaerolineae bacterium]